MSTKSLEQQVAELSAIVADHAKVIAALRAALGGAGGAPSTAEANDRELDSEHGNPKLRFNPRDWKGAPRRGWLMSRVEPDCLEMYAEALDFFAQKNDEAGEKDARGGPKSKWDRLDARRARGWARRIRDGWRPPQAAESAKPAGSWGSGGGWGNRGPSQTTTPPTEPAHNQTTGEIYDEYAGDTGGDDEIPF